MRTSLSDRQLVRRPIRASLLPPAASSACVSCVHVFLSVNLGCGEFPVGCVPIGSPCWGRWLLQRGGKRAQREVYRTEGIQATDTNL